MVDVLRDYLAARFANAPLSLTSSELTRTLHGDPSVPLERLSRLLDEVDQIKFGRRPVTRERAMELGRETRAIVRTTDAAILAHAAAATPKHERAA